MYQCYLVFLYALLTQKVYVSVCYYLFPILCTQVTDPDSGNICDLGEVGELCYQSPYTMIEYLDRPEETKQYFDSDGFCHTGDLVSYNQHGHLIYVDRLKEMIKYAVEYTQTDFPLQFY